MLCGPREDFPQTNGVDQLEGLPSAQHVNCPNPHLVEIQEDICGARKFYNMTGGHEITQNNATV